MAAVEQIEKVLAGKKTLKINFDGFVDLDGGADILANCAPIKVTFK